MEEIGLNLKKRLVKSQYLVILIRFMQIIE